MPVAQPNFSRILNPARRIITMKKLKKSKKKTVPKKTKVTKPTNKKAPKKVANKKKSYYKPKGKKTLFEKVGIPASPVPPVPVTTKDLKKHGITVATHSKDSTDKVPVPSKRPVKYLNNRDLLAQVILSKKQGKMSNELAKMLQLLTMRYGKKGNFANYCVDKETEALTKRGWLSYTEITTSDEILSYDINTKQLKWSKIYEVFVNEFDGDMHYLTTQGMNALVTPNHKFVSAERGLIPVENIISNEHIILNGSPVKDGTNSYTASEIEFIGWAITEGHYIKGSKTKHAIMISQKEGVKADQIRLCLWRANIHFIEYTNKVGIVGFHCTGPFVSKVYDTLAPTRIPTSNFITCLTQEQRLLLINTMVLGDGWERPSGGMSYIQKDKQHVDAMVMLCALAGLTTHTTKRIYIGPPSKTSPDGAVSDCFTINIYNEPKLFCKAEWIDFHGGKQGPGGRRENKPNLPTQAYKGMIWCPKTDYGTFVCRRSGYVYVTGNTYNDDMQSYAMLMLVKTWDSFDPAKSSNPFAFFTQCIKNSFIQYLKVEKKQRDIRDEKLVDMGMNPSFGFTYDYEEKQREADYADQEVIEAPTKLHEDVEGFDAGPDTNEDDPVIPESY